MKKSILKEHYNPYNVALDAITQRFAAFISSNTRSTVILHLKFLKSSTNRLDEIVSNKDIIIAFEELVNAKLSKEDLKQNNITKLHYSPQLSFNL